MPGLHIYTSNHLEALLGKLTSTISIPLPDVFQKEVVVVQSRGMARWLSLEVARQQGICSNVEFPFPRSFAYRIFKSINKDLPGESPWDPEILTWRIVRALPSLLPNKEFFSLQSYVSGDNADLRLYQLAGKIAHVFDQYIVYRPELLRDWERGVENHWQATLWRALIAQTQVPHGAQLLERTLRGLDLSKRITRDLPPRISLFGISVLPKFYLELFASLASYREVNLFLIQPTQESWGHITSTKEGERIADKANLSAAELHLEEGHPLLASWGSLGREFFRNIMEFDPHLDDPAFVENRSPSLLHQLQNDILFLRDRSKEKGTFLPGDTSIQVHSCHSPIRELEVLRDQMLAWLAADKDLRPRDILVMIPDVETYTPFIQAVFDVPEKKNERIPFSIADRCVKSEGRVAETVLAILGLPDGRCETREILGLFDCRSLLARFNLAEEHLDTIRRWVLQAGIRWGIDADHRASFDLPAFDQNCWDLGMKRLLLGYAMLGHGEQVLDGALPIDEVEGSSAEVLGRFTQFIRVLFKTCEELKTPRSLTEWAATLQRLLNSFFVSDVVSERELRFIRTLCQSLVNQHNLSDCATAMPLSVLRSYLRNALESGGLNEGFLTGGVTFCALKPMRSLPFKIICLLGMNDKAFPRQTPKVGFDLMQQHPKAGDPSSRKDDQYLFLETVMAAREKLHISYIGQSAKDNSVQPPSVLVSELVDCLCNSFVSAEKPLTPDAVVVKHRLQAFSSEYFKGERLFTFSQANADGFGALQQKRVTQPPFLLEPLPAPSEEFRTITVADLAEFFAHPAKHFLRRRLQIELGRDASALEENEPFALEFLDGYQMKQELLEKALDNGTDLAESLPLLQARGVLPYGRIGANSHWTLCEEVRLMAQHVSPFLDRPLSPLSVRRTIGEFHLYGELQVSASRQLQYRCSRIKGADILRAWVKHLAANLAPGGSEIPTTLVGSDSAITFAPLPNAEELMTGLLALYWRGLSEPLKLFPSSSYAYAKARYRPGKRTSTPPLQAAEKSWGSSDWNNGEEQDSWFQFCFRGTNPLDADFEQVTAEIFEPLLAVMEVEAEVTE